MKTNYFRLAVICVHLAAASMLSTRAHCDAMDGPVVKAAQKALATKDLKPVLIWVRTDDEAEVQKAFKETLAVRKLSADAQALADRFFFETIVRIHRAGEGAPFTGLKPAGCIDPVIAAADRTLRHSKADEILELLRKEVATGVHVRFEEALRKRAFPEEDVDAGRQFVRAYVEYIHYVEALHAAASTRAHGHPANGHEKHER